MIRESKYIIRRVIIGVLITLILSFISSCEVHAESVSFEDHNGTIYYNPAGNDITNTRQNTLYYNSSTSNPASIYVPVELLSTADYPVVFNGKYLIDFYIYGVGTFYQDYNCSNFTSNFRYIDLQTGNWVSSTSKIKSNCVSVNKTKYNGYDSIHILYSFTLNTDNNIGATEFSFQITKYNFFTSLDSGTNIGYSIGNLYNYDVAIVDAFNNGAKLEDISDSINNSSQNIINNNNQNTNSIINGIEGATQQAIDNANQNTEKEIESQQVCKVIDKSYIIIDNKYLNFSNGGTSSANEYGITDYIKIENNNLKIISTWDRDNLIGICYYNSNKSFINCQKLYNLNILDIPNNAYYTRISISKTTNRPQFELCQNGNQAMNDSINETNDTLKDNTIDDPSGEFEDFKGMLAENGVITELITLPISLFTNILNSINGTCSQFVLGELMGTNLTIPCINISDYLGSFLWNVIDILFSGIFVYTISKKMIQVFENMTSMRESDDLA